jgi:hypothetical protein
VAARAGLTQADRALTDMREAFMKQLAAMPAVVEAQAEVDKLKTDFDAASNDV